MSYNWIILGIRRNEAFELDTEVQASGGAYKKVIHNIFTQSTELSTIPP